MRDAAVIYYWARFGAVVFVALLALGVVLRRSRQRAARRDLLFGVAGGIGLGAAVLLAGAAADYVLTGALLVGGLAVGFLAGGVRPLAASLTAIATVFATIMLLFGAAGAVGIGIAVLAFGVGVPLGQGVRRKPAEAVPAPAAGEGTAA